MKIHRSLPLLSASLITALGAPAAAQTPAAVSESYALLARATASGSGAAAGTLYLAQRATVGLATDGLRAKSDDYHMEAGMAWIEPQLTSGPPVLLGLSPEGGDAGGGTPVRIFGFNLQDPTGPTGVEFAGGVLPLVTVQSNTALDVIAPPGVNEFGNPLGTVNVTVSTMLGSDDDDGGYVYRPGLTQMTSGCFGCTLVLELETEPGAFHMLARGTFASGFALPIPPIAGALEIVSGVVPMTGLAATASGVVQYQLPIPELAVPPFILQFQAVALDSLVPLGGSFTNRIAVTLGP